MIPAQVLFVTQTELMTNTTMVDLRDNDIFIVVLSGAITADLRHILVATVMQRNLITSTATANLSYG